MPVSGTQAISVAELAAQLGLECSGDTQRSVMRVSSLPSATAEDLCFIQSSTYLEQVHNSACGALIVPTGFASDLPTPAKIWADNPYLAFVRAIEILHPDQPGCSSEPEIHETARIAATAKLGADVSIGAYCVVGDNVELGAGSTLGTGCIVEDGVYIGPNTLLHPRVTLCHDVTVGAEVILHPGVVIGSDGFGLVFDDGDWVKVPHLGTVRIGDRVEIGANTTVDRGALDDTIIEDGVKLDNLIQVAHNVRIGRNTAIAACVGIAGSATIGKNCRIGGAAVVLGHLSVADNVTVTAMSLVTKTIKQSGTYSSGVPLLENSLWHRNNARYKSLDKLARTVSRLDKKIGS